MRVLLDTNVLLSGIATRGVCEAILDACVDSADCVIVLSEHILAEFAEHAAGKFSLPCDRIEEVLGYLRRHAEIVAPAPLPAEVCSDPHDVAVLGTAVAGGADVLVTGDAELLAMGSFRGVPILSPRAFYGHIR